MSIIHTIIISIIEGLTEFLPISSTAHMDIARTLLGIPTSSFIKSFEIIIQLGAIIAVAVLFYKKVFSSWKYIINLIIAFIPTGIIGFILYKLVKSFLLGNILVEASALLIGGIIIVIFENYQISHNKIESEEVNIEKLTFKQLIILGTAQALAVIPGISRSGAVIISGRAIGLNRILITEFSFLLAVPTMLAASVYDIYKSGVSVSSSEWGTIILGFFVAFIVAFVVIKWFLEYIRKHTFKIFGWYRIILGIILILALFFKVI
ncbi:MAG: undecaprenyl-diphosphate phosphatase [Candidatus Nomurabacteria bacterium]